MNNPSQGFGPRPVPTPSVPNRPVFGPPPSPYNPNIRPFSGIR